MRSVRNFKIDLRIAPHDIYLAGIHWQVAQASSLENIEFYMRYNSETPGNTQQVCIVQYLPNAQKRVSMCHWYSIHSDCNTRASTWKTDREGSWPI